LKNLIPIILLSIGLAGYLREPNHQSQEWAKLTDVVGNGDGNSEWVELAGSLSKCRFWKRKFMRARDFYQSKSANFSSS